VPPQRAAAAPSQRWAMGLAKDGAWCKQCGRATRTLHCTDRIILIIRDQGSGQIFCVQAFFNSTTGRLVLWNLTHAKIS